MTQLNKIIPGIFWVCLIWGCKQVTPTEILPFISKPDFTPEWIAPSDAAFKNIHQIPAFKFQDQDGHFVTEKTVEGKIYVANFMFTSCGSICPRMAENLSIVQKKYLLDQTILMLSHSVMPQKDSVPVLKNYANHLKEWFQENGSY